MRFRPQSVKQLKQRVSMKLATIVQGTSPPIPEDDVSLNVSHCHSFTALLQQALFGGRFPLVACHKHRGASYGAPGVRVQDLRG